MAKVELPIIGMDFLSHFNLLVDCRNNRLLDGITSLSSPGHRTKSTVLSVKTIASRRFNTTRSNSKSHSISLMAARRDRRTRQFLVTVGPLDYYADIRSDLLSYFEDTKEYCVSVEKYHSENSNKQVHLHAYIEFHSLWRVSEVRERVAWFDHTIDVQSVKSKRNVLLYITKEDDLPLFNCREALLSFQYRARAWARRTQRFSADDPFVLEHTNKYRVLQELHREIRSKQKRQRKDYPPPSHFWGGWRMQVFAFVHGRLCARGPGKALYLWGAPGTGKTYVIEEILQMYSLVPYMPVPGQFFMGDFSPCDYDVILFEEWSWESYAGNKSQIKRLLEGKDFPRDTKFHSRTVMNFKGCVIIISNEPSPAYHEPALARRLCVIESNEGYDGADDLTSPGQILSPTALRLWRLVDPDVLASLSLQWVRYCIMQTYGQTFLLILKVLRNIV